MICRLAQVLQVASRLSPLLPLVYKRLPVVFPLPFSEQVVCIPKHDKLPPRSPRYPLLV